MTTHNAGAAPEQGNPRGESVPRGNRPAATCERCGHRPHESGGCKARYHVTFEKGEPGDPCLCEVGVAGLTEEPEHPGYGWHNDGDECIGPDCINPAHFEELVR